VAVSGQSGWESALILPSFRILKYEIVEETRSFVCWFIGLIIGDAKPRPATSFREQLPFQ
jgi:hypothetical protein